VKSQKSWRVEEKKERCVYVVPHSFFRFLARGRTHLQALVMIGSDNTKFQYTRQTYNIAPEVSVDGNDSSDFIKLQVNAPCRTQLAIWDSCKVPLYLFLVGSPQ
jgi:hypothetical protein